MSAALATPQRHDRLHVHERFLAPMRDQHMRVLQIGVKDGHSLKTWEQFFPNATILAIDVNADCLRQAGGRITIELMDQSDLPGLANLVRGYGPFGLIVDDGSHMWEHQLTSLRQLFPHVQPGGCYILQGLDSSYGDEAPLFRGVARTRPSEYLQHLCDLIAADTQINPAQEEDAFLRSCPAITEFVALSRGHALLRRKPG